MAWSAMANRSDGKGGGFERAPAGTHPAVLVGIIDLGQQWQDPFGGEGEGRWEHRLYYVYELVTKKRAGMAGNHLIAIDLKLSMHEKAKMRQWVEARTGKKIPDGTAYDVSEELGKPCLLQVLEKNGYPKIGGVMGIPDGLNVPAPVTTPTAWKLDPAKVDAIPDWVPYLYGQSIKDVIRNCKEIKGDRKAQAKPEADDTDTDADIPW
jgi:hypothetical protein